MLPSARPHRSVLYMPGSNARALEKAKTLPVDALIFDLEDAVSPAQKLQARTLVCAAAVAAKAGAYGGRKICIRANALDTPWGREDLIAIASAGADAVLLPKVNCAEDVAAARSILQAAKACPHTELWVMMETPLAILQAQQIASAPGVSALIMGTADLVTDLHAQHSAERLEVITSLNICVLAARAYGLMVLDGVYLDLADQSGFEAQCRQGLALGFDGKTVIHPSQLDAANRIFAPSTDDLERAAGIITAHSEAAAQGKGVVLVDGKLIENLHVVQAQRIVAMAAAIEVAAANSVVS